MSCSQKYFLFFFALSGFLSSLYGVWRCKHKKDNLGLVGPFIIFGAFVWADLVIFGFFWTLFSLTCLFIADWTLFLLGLSIFWLIRSFGETIYWFNQQFSEKKRSSINMFFFAKIFNNDLYTLWFIMQIVFQCVCVVSAISTIYFAREWLFQLGDV